MPPGVDPLFSKPVCCGHPLAQAGNQNPPACVMPILPRLRSILTRNNRLAIDLFDGVDSLVNLLGKKSARTGLGRVRRMGLRPSECGGLADGARHLVGFVAIGALHAGAAAVPLAACMRTLKIPSIRAIKPGLKVFRKPSIERRMNAHPT
jgi:hypothetical protein